jgi:uncharacterized RDD family membrane protein YckC
MSPGESDLPGPGDELMSAGAEPVPPDGIESVPLDPPGTARVLGPRVAAALIDITVLAGLFVLLGLAVGEPSPHPAAPGSVSLHLFGGQWYLTLGQATLSGWWLAGYLVLVLVYFFALEATTGQTAGKAVACLRVTSQDGGRPAAGAIAVRTLLRLVDWVPFLYLAGFICLLATGQRRERVGDLAAGTAVVRPLALARGQTGRIAFVLPVAILLMVGLSVEVGPHSGPGHFQAHGVSFRYPASWHQGTPQVRITRDQQNVLWSTAVGPDQADSILVEAYRLNIPITAANIQQAAPSVSSATQGLFRQARGTLQAGPEPITMAGLPALRFQGTLPQSGHTIQSTIIFAFDGRTEYFINCHTVAAHATEMNRGCAQVVHTFQAGPAGPPG